MRVLVFDIDGQRFGLDASKVLEVLPAATLTFLPNLPPGVQGVLDVRGTVVPIIGVRRALGLEQRPIHSTDHLVIASTRGRTVGLHVDHALEIVNINTTGLDSSDDDVGDPISRVARLDGGLISINLVEAIVGDWEVRDWRAVDPGNTQPMEISGEATEASGSNEAN